MESGSLDNFQYRINEYDCLWYRFNSQKCFGHLWQKKGCTFHLNILTAPEWKPYEEWKLIIKLNLLIWNWSKWTLPIHVQTSSSICYDHIHTTIIMEKSTFGITNKIDLNCSSKTTDYNTCFKTLRAYRSTENLFHCMILNKNTTKHFNWITTTKCPLFLCSGN